MTVQVTSKQDQLAQIKPRYWLNLALFSLGTLTAAAVGAYVYASYRAAVVYLHPPRVQRTAQDHPGALGVKYQAITLRARDGVELSAWYTPPQNGAVILAAHGYGGVRSAAVHALFARHRYGLISWDARAHGESGGELSTLGYYEALDVEAALDFALGQEGVRRVGAYGQSMGAATIIRAAAYRPEIEAVVADSAFATLGELFDSAIPYVVMRPAVRLFAELSTGVAAAEVQPIDDIGRLSPRPVFIIQGADDNLIPRNSAERLYAAAGEPRELWIEPGVDHVALFTLKPEEYERRVIEFFEVSLLE